jgi:hypothetical protein
MLVWGSSGKNSRDNEHGDARLDRFSVRNRSLAVRRAYGPAVTVGTVVSVLIANILGLGVHSMSIIGMAALSLDYDDCQESRDAALSICRDGPIRRPRQAGASRSLGSS